MIIFGLVVLLSLTDLIYCLQGRCHINKYLFIIMLLIFLFVVLSK